MAAGTDFPDDAAREAWARARDHGGAARVDLPGGVIGAIELALTDGRAVRVTLIRAGAALPREEALPLLERLLLLGGFEPFPLACSRADDHSMTCELDLDAYDLELSNRHG